MEEVDAILILSLRQINCPVEDDVKSVGQFSSELLIHSTVTCLHIINPSKYASLSPRLPNSASAKFRLCTAIASALEELGFTDSIGFERFLYPSEKDTRKLLSFLIERLPKPDDSSNEKVGKESSVSFASLVRDALTESRREIFLPLGFRERLGRLPDGSARSGNAFFSLPLFSPKTVAKGVDRDVREDVLTFARTRLPPPTLQSAERHAFSFRRAKATRPAHCRPFLPSLLSANQDQLAIDTETRLQVERAESEGVTVRELKSSQAERVNQLVANALRAAGGGQAGGPPGVSESAELSRTLEQLTLAGGSGDDRGDRVSRFQHEANFGRDDVTSHVLTGQRDERDALEEKEREKQRQREEEISALEQQVQSEQRSEQQLREDIRSAQALTAQLQTELEQDLDRANQLEEEYQMKKKILDLLEDKDKNVAMLRSLTNDSASRLIELAQQWEVHRSKFVEEHRRLRAEYASKTEKMRGQLDNVRSLREDMRGKIQEVRDREELLTALQKKYDALPKNIDRANYLRRIMDIIKNVRKQQREVVKILVDNRQLMLSINKTSDAINRAFALSEELVYQKAAQDDTRKQAYKDLIKLRDLFQGLISHVEESGSVKNETSDLENKVNAMKTRNMQLNLERIAADLQQVKDENKELMTKLQSASK